MSKHEPKLEERLDGGPPSVPWDLSADERQCVGMALLALAERGMWPAIAEEMGYPVCFLHAFTIGKAQGSRHFAAAVARAAKVDLEDLLAGLKL